MMSKAKTPEEYVDQLPVERKEAVERLRQILQKNLPRGFTETMSYGMIGFVVPHSIYPAGYHVNPREPVPFMSIANQKHHIALYHMGFYTDPDLLTWLQQEYPKYLKTKIDLGKGCIRFKKIETIPYQLIAELCQRMSLEEYLAMYEYEVKNHIMH
ncbi:MAG: DUF1801 domain-containing protein [Syntrophomonas sp.]|nr:DUF1801 domain-containing protein [Syntrophomonas sp.]